MVYAVQAVCDRNVGGVPTFVPCLVTPDEEDDETPGVECIEDPIWAPLVLDTKLPHVRVP